MKGLILVIAVITLSLPAVPQTKTVLPIEKGFVFDFTQFTKKGFLMTPEKYSGQYEPIGLVNFEAIPGAEFKLVEKLNYDRAYSINDKPVMERVYDWVIDTMLLERTLKKIYDKCIIMGADALVNIEYEIISKNYGVVKSGIDNPVTIYGVRIKGFAIKRKDN